MLIFMDFGCALLHIAVHFGAFCSAFWCILQCILVHIAVRFGAFRSAFCCKMRCNI